jgi:hypothetical protein
MTFMGAISESTDRVHETAAEEGKGLEPAALASIEQPETDDVVEGGDAIFASNLLSLGIGPSVIGDRDFIDAATQFGNLHRQLGLDAEPVRFEP